MVRDSLANNSAPCMEVGSVDVHEYPALSDPASQISLHSPFAPFFPSSSLSMMFVGRLLSYAKTADSRSLTNLAPLLV